MPVYARKGAGRSYQAHLEAVYLCPNSTCAELFIGYFFRTGPGLELRNLRPREPLAKRFSKHLEKVSPSFCKIYAEADKAEQFGLTQICGVGYRKALEFLIKDYLIGNHQDKEAEIKAIMLGPCIQKYIADSQIKEVARRATWLGNDEAHYQRRWVDKDLSDLKRMISLTVHWIEAEILTAEALKSMPDPT